MIHPPAPTSPSKQRLGNVLWTAKDRRAKSTRALDSRDVCHRAPCKGQRWDSFRAGAFTRTSRIWLSSSAAFSHSPKMCRRSGPMCCKRSPERGKGNLPVSLYQTSPVSRGQNWHRPAILQPSVDQARPPERTQTKEDPPSDVGFLSRTQPLRAGQPKFGF